MSAAFPIERNAAEVRMQELSDRQEIIDLIHLRARAADRRDVDLARSCYHPQATEDHAGYRGSAEAFLAHAPTGAADHPVSTMWHGIHSSLVQINGDEATAETYFSCVVRMNVTRADDGERDGMVTGRYLDRLVRYETRWVILERTLVFDWSRVDEISTEYWTARGMDPQSCHFGQISPTDLVYSLQRS